MILVDTSVWVDHLRLRDEQLVAALLADEVVIHPWIVGELALGGLPVRGAAGTLLRNLAVVPMATEPEVLELIDRRSLASSGIGYVDVHLVASAMLRPGTRLWTRDRKLQQVADDLGVGV